MRFLLDSDALYHWMVGSNVDRRVRSRVTNQGAGVSAVSAFELTQKHLAGKIRLAVPVSEGIQTHAFTPVAISVEHAERAARLPWHHRDPFDRLLIAQAQMAGLTIVSRDAVFDAYDVDVARF